MGAPRAGAACDGAAWPCCDHGCPHQPGARGQGLLPATCTGGRLHRGGGRSNSWDNSPVQFGQCPRSRWWGRRGWDTFVASCAVGSRRQCAPVFAAAAVAAQLCRITFPMDASLISRPQPWLSGTPCRRQRRARCRPAALFDDPSSSSNGAGSNPAPPQQQGSRTLNPIFPEPQRAAAKPLPVQTQRGVPTFKPSIADPPCLLCSGSGKVTCGDCRCGRGCRGSGSWHRQPGFGLRDAALANPACSWQAAVAPFSCIPAGT